eukprot:NODE_432_length_7521_cov_0.745891.p10 type:complete len:101 gc:universal NODE_432_length_7521_cov_0.745891:4691-4993(+)
MIFPSNFVFKAFRFPLVKAIPEVAPKIHCVVLTGIPMDAAVITVILTATFAAKPRLGDKNVISFPRTIINFCPIVNNPISMAKPPYINNPIGTGTESVTA